MHKPGTAGLAAILCVAISALSSAYAADNSRVNMRFLAKTDISRSTGCSVSLWQANRDPDKDKFAFVFFEKLEGSDQKRAPAVIKMGNRLVSMRRIAVGGKKGGYDIYPYQLYKLPGNGSFAVLELRVEEPEGEAVEISGGHMNISIPGKQVFRISVKGGAGCMTPAAAAPDAIPNAVANESKPARSARQSVFGRYPVCKNPRDPIEKHVCADEHLISLSLQAEAVLNHFRTGKNRELPEWLQMEYAHQTIAMEECNGKFRCLESVLANTVKMAEGHYLRRKAKSLARYGKVRFKVFQAKDSPGSDLMPSKSVQNFGWSKRLCQLRCAADSRCAGAGFDALQNSGNRYGYCTMKGQISRSLQNWRPLGVLLVKQ